MDHPQLPPGPGPDGRHSEPDGPHSGPDGRRSHPDSRRPSRARRAVLAGAVVLALSGAGAATVWASAAADAPSPVPSSSASPTPDSGKPGKGNQKPKEPKSQDQKSQEGKSPDQEVQDGAQDVRSQRGELLHGEQVVKRPDGSVVAFVTQRGTLESVSDSAITVKSDDGFSQSYAINADTKLRRIAAGDGKPATGSAEKGSETSRPRPGDLKATDLKAGDEVRVAGIKEGGTVTALRVVAGDLPDNAKGPGAHFGKGWLNGQGGGAKPSDSPAPAP